MTAHDGTRDGNTRPVEITVIVQIASTIHDGIGKLVKCKRRLALRAQERPRGWAEFRDAVADVLVMTKWAGNSSHGCRDQA